MRCEWAIMDESAQGFSIEASIVSNECWGHLDVIVVE